MILVCSAGRAGSGMAKEKVLVVGLGEVGRPLFELLKESGKFEVYGFDLDAEKMRSIGQSEDVLPPCC
jgi:UDP-N-acetyl-D-mannosaminuronate dehydrogenase